MLGINIKVDSQQVKDAKKQIDMLNRAMNDTDSLGDLTIGAGASTEVKKLTQEIQRLKQIASQGDIKGGILNRQQFTDAQRLMTSINQGVQNYARELKKVRDEYKQINQEQARLAALKFGGTADPTDLKKFEQNRTRMQELSRQQRDLESQRQRMQQMGAGASSAAARISGMGEMGQAGGGFGAILGKGLGLGIAALGIGSVLGFISKSRGLYGQGASHEATLGARGVRGGRGAAGLGYGPVEYMALMEQMSAQGMNSENVSGATRLSTAFARSRGMDAGQVAGMYGTMYGATGNAQNAAGVLSMAVASGIKSIKMDETFKLIARNTNTTAMALKGADASHLVGGAVGLGFAAMQAQQAGKSYGHYAKSNEFLNVAQHGLTGAGSDPGEIMLFRAMGGFGGDMNWKKKFKMDQMKEGGFLQNPQMLSEIIGRLSGDEEDKAAQLMTFFPKWNLSTESASQLMAMDKDGLLKQAGGKSLDKLKAGSEEEKALANRMEREYGVMPGASKTKTEAEWLAEQYALGEKMFKATAEIEKAMIGMVHGLVNSKIFDRMLAGIEETAKFTGAIAKFFTNPGKETAKAAFDRTPMIGFDPKDPKNNGSLPFYAASAGRIGGIEKMGYHVSMGSGSRAKGSGMRLLAEKLAGVNPTIGDQVDPWDSAHEKGKAQDYSVMVSDGKGGKRRATRSELVQILGGQGVSIGDDNRGRDANLSYLLEQNQNGWYVHQQALGLASNKPKNHKLLEANARSRVEKLNQKYKTVAERKRHMSEYNYAVETELGGGASDERAYEAGAMGTRAADAVTSTMADLLQKIHVVLENIERKTPALLPTKVIATK